MNTSTFRLRILAATIARTERKRTAVARIAFGIITALLTLGLSSQAVHAQDYNENLLYSFGTNNTDGINPQTPLINVNGTFYGITTGTIFSFDPSSNTETTLYAFSFNTPNGGVIPQGGLVYDSASGKIFGVTQQGGTGNNPGGGHGYGTIFSFDPSANTVSFPYSFKNNGDGNVPNTRMIDVNGTLYGTTQEGYTTNYGTVFSYNIATNGLKTLHNFHSTAVDGSAPGGSLTYDSASGLLYGTTFEGGSNNTGTIYSIKPDGTGYQVLYSFGSSASGDGNDPGGLTEINGIFYGTAGGGTAGDGTVYAFDPRTNTETTLYNFQGIPSGATSGDGRGPTGDLTYDSATGELFGTTYQGGIPGSAQNDPGQGTVFAIKPDGTGYHQVYAFQGAPNDASNPFSGLLDVSGILYGTTPSGGINGQGAIYSLNAATFTLPHAANDSYTAKYQTAFAAKAPGVLANDNPGGSNKPTATLVSNVTHGTLTLNSDGSFVYTPANGFLGTDSFTYYVTNPLGKSNTATVTFTVQATAPVTHTDAYTITYNTSLTVAAPGVLANDAPGDTGTLTANLVTQPSHGTLTFHANGSFAYTPTTGFIGTDTFTYNVTNAVGASNTAPVNIKVQPAPPIAANDTYAPQYQTAYVVKAPGVLANDNAGGSSTLTAALVSSPTHGTLTLFGNGSFTYTPASGFVGTDSFTYKDTNSIGISSPATVTLNVHAVAPVAHTDTYTAGYNTTLTIPASGVLYDDYPGVPGTLTAVLVSSPTHGTVSLHGDGSFVYTPNTGYIGSDTFTYKDTNSVGTSNTAPVNLTVQPVLAKAANDTYAPAYQTAYAVKAPGVLANDNAGGSSTLFASLVSNPGHGSLTFNSDGSFVYTPAAGYLGTDTFTYQAANVVGYSNVATVTLNVHAVLPKAANDSYAPAYQTAYVVKAPGVLANDGTGGGTGSLTATLVSNPTHGTLTFNSDGSFVYTPANGFVGTDTFTYQAVNDLGTSNTATVSLVVQTSVPLAHNDFYTVGHNTTLVLQAPGILANDNAGAPGLIAILATQPSHGTLTFNGDGSFTYVPNTGYSGTDSFVYYDDNSVGISNTATVTLTVQ